MKAFEFDHRLIESYARFSRSEGLPDEAYKPLTGDDKELSRRYARLNREQRERAKGLPQLFKNWSPPEILAERDHKLKAMAQDDLASVEAKASDFQAIRASAAWQNLKTASDLYVSANFYMAAFFTAKAGSAADTDAMPLTEHVWQAAGGQTPAEHLSQGAALTSEKMSAFHWFIEFPEIMERDGGFDAVIGNPPWERIKLSEQEFFAARSPMIAAAPNKAERQKLIDALEAANPESADGRLWREFVFAKRTAEAASEFARSSGRYPLAGRGDVNTYALFAELFSRLARPTGRAGVIVPTGIATDATTAPFFAALVESKRLAALYSFENEEMVFAGVHHSFKFALLTIGMAENDESEFAFFLRQVTFLANLDRRFSLASDEIARLNPNTRTAPVFRSRADAELTAKLYARAPVLIEERSHENGGNINPWGITFQTMFHMSNDSGFFRTPAQMEGDGWRRDGMDWVLEATAGVERRVPLYEAKMIHHFDHRWATYGAGASDDEEGARDCTLAEKQNPDFESSPRYWVPEDEVILRAARVPSALKSAVRQGRGESGKGRRKADTDAQEGGRAAALKAFVTWLAGAFPLVEGRSAREADIFRLLGRAQDYRGALKASPERFLLDPKTLAAGADMQRETPLTADDLTFITEGPEDVLALVEMLIAVKQPRWLMGWRDITNATNERTVIGTAFPEVGVGNSLPIWYPGHHIDGKLAATFVGMLSCMAFDFSARHKVGGTHLNFFIAQQLPVLPPSVFSSDDLGFVSPRVLELTYTSRAMKAWAEDLGYSGQPFVWDDDRRAQLRAELDVFFARKYGLTDEELRYVLDPAKVKGVDYPSETFRVLKEKETRLYGEYRTERLVLDTWKQTEAGAAPVSLPASITSPSPADLPDGAWARATQQPYDASAALTAILKAINGPTPKQSIRFTAALVLEPHLLTALLPAAQAQEWRRLNGQEAEPRTGNVVGFAARTNQGWGTSVSNHRGNGRLIEDLSTGTWAPGPGLDVFDTAGWPDGRARFVLEALRSLDLASTVSSMPDEVRDWIAHAAAA